MKCSKTSLLKQLALALALVAVAPLTITATVVWAGSAPIVMKFAHGFAADNPEGRAGEAIKAYIEASPVLKDKVKFQHYPGGSLFSTNEARTAIKTGGIELASEVSSYLSKSIPEFELADLPFLFNSSEHFYATLAATGQGEKMMKEAESLGITFVCQRPSTNFFYKYFNSKRELRKPEDFKGLKLRCAPGIGFTNVTKLMGSSTVAMAIAEVMSAFQSGMIDGTLTNENGWAMFRLMEYSKFVTAYNVNSSYSWYVVNTSWWNTVPAEIKPELIKAIKAGADVYTKASEEQRIKAWKEIQQLSKEGKFTVTFLTPEEAKAWRETEKPLYDQLGKKFGFELINKAVELAPNYPAVGSDVKVMFQQ